MNTLFLHAVFLTGETTLRESFSFVAPGRLWLLFILIPLIVFRWLSDRKTTKQLETVVARRLRRKLVTTSSQVLSWIHFGLLLLAIAFFILAFAQPRFGYEKRYISKEGRSLLIAIDTSRSMLAQDLKPSRLSRAKTAAEDLVRALPADRIGLIAFAGKSFLQVPLTVDHEAIIESIHQLDTQVIPRGGSNLADMLEHAVKTLDDSQSINSALIIFSDGEEHEGSMTSQINAANDSNISVVSFGVGTEKGGFIPTDDGNLLKNRSGEIVRTRLNRDKLKALALATQGVYADLENTESFKIVSEKTFLKLKSKKTQQPFQRIPIERYRWPLGMGVICLFLATMTFLPLILSGKVRS